ncbi:MAG: sodium:proton antiporter [Candidatus Marinimicrobia bacterium]|nr:sodium:proton antiporter [Candidatus Neomarinimicrobiota bacterium]MCF7904086.1 sodium:proton antiporter [Candidatus Neomarinimicrobiota bacterium]
MKKVLIFSILLVIGLVASQILPGLFGEDYHLMSEVITVLTLTGLAFIMIHVGYEFELDKTKLRSYGWDYVVAMTAAAFPWMFVAIYFVYVLGPEGATSWEDWKPALVISRFAAPTSAGVLFSMLAAAGLSSTWLFKKARVLAIFDDLDTVLLMIPLSVLMVGFAWQMGVVVLVMAGLIALSWIFLHRWSIPVTWPYVLSYAIAIVAVSEVVYIASKLVDSQVPIHIEILLPAFVLGTIMKRPAGSDPHADDSREGHLEGPESESEQKGSSIISSIFIFLVGLNMPDLFSDELTQKGPQLSAGMIAFHVLMVTIISNLGKMFPAFVYRREAHWKERLALAIGMWPRGEVGAGILILALGYGIGGSMVTVAALSLTVNLVLTGVFIWIVKALIRTVPDDVQAMHSS